MFPNLIEDVNDGTTDHDYDRRTMGPPSEFLDIGAALDVPSTLKIAHKIEGSGMNTVVRTMARIDDVVEDSLGNQGVSSAYLVTVNPIKVAPEGAHEKTISKLKSFLNKADTVGKLIRQEV